MPSSVLLERRVLVGVSASIVQSERPGMALRVRAATPNHIVGTWHDVSVAVWRKETTVEGIRASEQCFEEVCSRYPSGAYMLTVVEETASLPPPEVRRALTAVLHRSKRVVLSAVVYEGKGFRAAAVRGVVTGLTVLTRLPYPHTICASVSDAVCWFDSMGKSKSWTGAALAQALDDARRDLAESL
jgi:hypothetical protein